MPPRATAATRTRTRANGAGKADPARIAALEAELAVPLEDQIEAEVAATQARLAGHPPGRVITFYGAEYRLAPKIPIMALIDFGAEAAKGTSTEDPSALAAMRDILRRCFQLAPPCRRICAARCPDECARHCAACTAAGPVAAEVPGCAQYDPGDWPLFHTMALDRCAGVDELFDVVNDVIALETARPTT